MGLFSTLLLLATGVCLPSFDVYSDIALALKLLRGYFYINQDCKSKGEIVEPHPKLAIAMMTPVLLSWMFVAKQWYQAEKGVRQKLITFPILLLQLYPQYRALKVLYYAKWKKSNEWQQMKDAWEMNVSHLGEDRIYCTILHLISTFIFYFRALFRVSTTGARNSYNLVLFKQWGGWSYL